tara:strand:+ start:321 stop:2036 length:1716 start_codon:yes stop_codon:yes gene_type:complete
MRIHEVAPPGREKQVKKLKKKFDDKSIAYAIAWAQHNKHGKPKKESQEDGPGDMGMNKYGLAATKFGGKFRSYRHGKLTGEFDSMEELQKHQMDLIKDESVDPLRSDRGAKEELAKEIYYNNDEYQKMYPTWEDFMNSEDFDEENNRLRSKFEASEQDEVRAILNKHNITSIDDIEYGSDVYDDLFNYFANSGEMPYGIMKARTGMPDEWIADRIYDLGILTEAPFQKKQAQPFSRTQKALNTLGSMFGSRKAQGRLNTGVEANKIAKNWAEYTSGSQATNINRELKGFIASVGKNASPETSAKWFQKNHNITIEPAEYTNTFKPDGTPQGSQTVFDLVKNNALDSKNIIEWFRKNHQMELTQNDVNQLLANSTTAITDFVQRKEAGQMGVKAPAPTDQTDTTQTTADQDAEKKQDPTLAQIKKLNPDATGKAVKALDKLKPGNLKPLTPPEEAELAPILNKIGTALADPSKRAKLVNMMTAGKYTDFVDFANVIHESISREDLAKLDYLARQGLVPSNKVSRFKTAMRTLSKGKDLSITYKDDVVDVVIKLASIITKPGVMQMVRRGLKK